MTFGLLIRQSFIPNLAQSRMEGAKKGLAERRMIVRAKATSLLDISTVAARYGVSLRTLRFYEAQGIISPMRSGLLRLYSGRDCVRLEIILKGKRLGLSLREIAALIQEGKPDAESKEKSIIDRMSVQQLRDQMKTLNDRRQEIDGAIKELEAALKKITR